MKACKTGMKISLAAVAVLTLCQCIHENFGAPVEATKELILTPLIKSGELDMARAAAEDKVSEKLKSAVKVKSFSGYLTVDEKANSNIFFWYFPAEVNSEKAPVILHVNESPGMSCLSAIFLENGPFGLSPNNELQYKNTTWTKAYNLLYIDAPVGSGFSYTDKPEGYAKGSEDEAAEVYETLQQFFTLFKELQPLDFYMTGSQYAGVFIPHIASKIDRENKAAALKINLKGFLVNSPFLDLKKQAAGGDLANYFYALGLVDDEQKKDLDAFVAKITQAVEKGDEATILKLSSEFYHHESPIAKKSGYRDFFNALETKEPETYERYKEFVETSQIHEYLHVGLHSFMRLNYQVLGTFVHDFFEKHLGYLQDLMDKDYKVLFIAPQFSLTQPFAILMNVVKDLEWKGAAEFKKAPRKIWRAQGEVGGYVKQSGKFSFVLMRNAGSRAFHDQPEWSFDLLQRFIEDKGFD